MEASGRAVRRESLPHLDHRTPTSTERDLSMTIISVIDARLADSSSPRSSARYRSPHAVTFDLRHHHHHELRSKHGVDRGSDVRRHRRRHQRLHRLAGSKRTALCSSTCATAQRCGTTSRATSPARTSKPATPSRAATSPHPGRHGMERARSASLMASTPSPRCGRRRRGLFSRATQPVKGLVRIGGCGARLADGRVQGKEVVATTSGTTGSTSAGGADVGGGTTVPPDAQPTSLGGLIRCGWRLPR